MTNIIIGFVLGAVAVYAGSLLHTKPAMSPDKQIADYYANSVATLVSAHSLRERMTEGKRDYVLVDVRAASDYEREHIATAINIDPSREADLVVADFKAVIAENPGKEIIIYCYSIACMTGRKVGNLLAENGIYVKELTIGWNEWRYGWETWNHETDWETVGVNDYVVSGKEPGAVPESAIKIKTCGIDGTLGC